MPKFIGNLNLGGNTITNVGTTNVTFSGNSSDVKYTPIANFPVTPNATPTDVQKAIDNLFTYANSGKTDIAGVIGAPATSLKTFAELKAYIEDAKNALATLINRAEGTAIVTDGVATQALKVLTDKLPDVRAFKQEVKLRRTAGSTYTINLNKASDIHKMALTVFKLVNDTATTEFTSTFSNAQAGDFLYDTDAVEFDGRMKLKLKSTTLTDASPVGDVYTFTFDATLFADVRPKEFTVGKQMVIESLPLAQIVRASGKIDISDTSSIDSVAIDSNFSDGSTLRFAASVDGGNVYKAWNGLAWIAVHDVANPNASTFATAGMNESTLGGLTVNEFDSLIGTSTDLRFAYYLAVPTFTDYVYVNEISINGKLTGTLSPVIGLLGNSVSWTMPSTTQVVVTFNETDTYQINWIDT